MPFLWDEGGKLNVNLPDDPSPWDFLRIFLDDRILELIVEQTNLYAQQKIVAAAGNMLMLPHSK